MGTNKTADYEKECGLVDPNSDAGDADDDADHDGCVHCGDRAHQLVVVCVVLLCVLLVK